MSRICCLLIVLLGSTTSPAQVETKLLASDGAPNDHFGHTYGVAVEGHTLLVGAHRQGGAGVNAGAVYAYRRIAGTWTETQKLVASDADPEDRFGNAVAMDGGVAIIGARADEVPGLGVTTGSAYLFRFDGLVWTEEQKILPAGVSPGDAFGWAVAIDGDVAVIGAPFDEDVGEASNWDSGAVYVFRHDGTAWVEEQRLDAFDGMDGDRFGESVAVSNGVIIVGASLDDGLGDNTGAAYVFRHDGTSWVHEQKLTASDFAPQDIFGSVVSLDGDRAVVGAPFAPMSPFSGAGAVYAFEYDGTAWTETQIINHPAPWFSTHMGTSLSLEGDLLAVGTTAGGINIGSIVLYDHVGGSWVHQQEIVASDGDDGDRLGASVATDGIHVVGGAYGDEVNGFNAGSAYAYQLAPLATHPGSGEDLVLLSGVDGPTDPDDVLSVAAGNEVTITLWSPLGTLNNHPYLIVAQLFDTGTAPASIPGFPELQISPGSSNPPVVLYDGGSSLFGPTPLPVNGATIQFVVGTTFPGQSAMIQGFSLAGSGADNGFFATTNGHELIFP